MDRADLAGAAAATAVYTFAVSHSFQAVGVVRRRARDVLTEWGLPEATAEEVVLVISELVTNAVLHALPPAELRLFLHGGVVRVEVCDSGAAPVWPGSVPASDERGRGRDVVEALALRHGADVRSDSTTYWAELPAC
ncbi:ATP-binding protein [Microbispora triticiradicis]|nr:ATP-binding protein [Microbispora triticiradicis]